jgi:hypothetical protein
MIPERLTFTNSGEVNVVPMIGFFEDCSEKLTLEKEGKKEAL